MKKTQIGVIGLGYVGLPLAVEFARKFSVIGFDINTARVTELRNGHDSTLEVSDDKLQSVLVDNFKFQVSNVKTEAGLYLTDNLDDIRNAPI